MTLLADACTSGQGVAAGTGVRQGAGQGQGMGLNASSTLSPPNKEATRDVRLTLFALAAVLAGCTVRTSDRNAFPRNRWLPPAFKCYILSALGCHSQAGFDLLADRPDLQNLFLDSESESGGSEVLPHPYCSLGRLIVMQAVIMARKAITGVCVRVCVSVCVLLYSHSFHLSSFCRFLIVHIFRFYLVFFKLELEKEEASAKKNLIATLIVARTLTDLAGRDDITASILVFISQYDKEQINNTNELLKIILDTSITSGDCPNPALAIAITDVLKGNTFASNYLKSIIMKPIKTSKKCEIEKKWYEKIYNSKYLKEKISLRTLGGSGRRTFLLKEKNVLVPERVTRSQSYIEPLSGIQETFLFATITLFVLSLLTLF